MTPQLLPTTVRACGGLGATPEGTAGRVKAKLGESLDHSNGLGGVHSDGDLEENSVSWGGTLKRKLLKGGENGHRH